MDKIQASPYWIDKVLDTNADRNALSEVWKRDMKLKNGTSPYPVPLLKSQNWRKDWRAVKPRKDVFYSEMILLIRLSQALGLITLSKNAEGHLQNNIMSVVGIYSLLLLAILTALNIFSIVEKLQWIAQLHFSFDDSIMIYSVLIYHFLQILTISALCERKKLLKYMKSWEQFEIKYTEITGKTFELRMKNKQYFALVLMAVLFCSFIYFVIYATTAELAKLSLTSSFNVINIILNGYNGMTLTTLCVLWYFVTYAIQESASLVLSDLKKSRLTTERLEAFRSLWLELKNLCVDLGTSFSVTYIFYLLFVFVMAITIIYSSVYIYTSGQGDSINHFRFGFSIVALVYMSTIANCAHAAKEAVTNRFRYVLFQSVVTEKNRFILKKLKSFAVIVALDDFSISLSGFVSLNKKFILSMYGSLFTYLIVVLQFRSSQTA